MGPVWEPTEYNIVSEEYEVPKGEVNAEIESESGVSGGYSPRAGGVRGNSVLTDLSSGDHAVVEGKSSGDTALADISDDNIDKPGPMDEFTEAEYEYDSSDVGDHADLELATLIRGLSVENTGAASGRESSSRNKTTPATFSRAIGSGQLSSRSHALRRKRGRTQKNNRGSDDEGFLQPPSGKPTPGTRGGPRRSLACPFAKSDPRRHHACFSKKLSRIRDVKQHLARKHTPEFYCFRCSTIFPDQAGLAAHIGDVAGLFCTPCSALDGVSQQQQQRLSRKSNPRHSEEEQWFSIWDILFPGSERPSSAYTEFGLSEDLCSYREYSHGRVMAAVVDGLQAGGLLAPGAQGTTLEEVRRVIADQLDSVFEQWLATPSFSSPSDTTSSNQQRGSAVSTRQLTPASSEDGGGGQEIPSGSQPSYRPSDDVEAILNQHRANESMEQTDPGLRSDSSSYPQDMDQSVLGMADHFDFDAWIADQGQDTVMLNLDASHDFGAAPSFMQFGESEE
ncbi:hypothetical protein F5Y04DRAFT_283548 [Hypomontagnella monticulosa]|nr:hypothetical protein F5Y04DRAFT_283548 [Hypomontagnella monticulosa]